ncbi:PREDICTED: interferon-induced protein with tetratricopeptide repeats 2-like [Cyprinodon variegatus]|uniref:interferon-induced protein with tetratricopeptide repeats 2-like n=1 Tax=Cyprinodon variegatus TaxID=28743 RepID=UPI00074268F1|nr:PREDICTED: interferon-induced protein with tetratricopeptide repeats 2-like [Cyprinodon variegatus]
MNSTETLESRLKALQCHFTWNLEANRQNLVYLRYRLQDISTEEGNVWLGHIYNLQGFIQYKLGSSEEALNIFRRATETFQRLKNSDEGPWLMVNFGNLAWLHHLMGEDEKSQDYLSKVEALMREYPAPPEEELYPEVCAEKAWTLMRFDKEKQLQAAELFQRAVRMQPDNVEWQSSLAILSAQRLKEDINKLHSENLERLRAATERDPDNLCVAVLYLEAQAASVKNQARELAERILERPINNYSGFEPLLSLYRKHISVDAAAEIVTEALRRNPNSRYAKRSAAKWLTKNIFSDRGNPDTRIIDKAIRLWEEVIKAYPESSLEEKISLADVHTKVDIKKADQMYSELLDRKDLDPAEKQMLYCRYAKHLYFIKKDSEESIKYHMKAAEIQEQSKYRQKSITELKKVLEKNNDSEICKKIQAFLTSLNIEE